MSKGRKWWLPALGLIVSALLACSVDSPGEGDMGPSRRDGAPVRPDMGRPPPPQWRWESPQPQGNNLRGLFGLAGSAAAQDELYTVGDSSTLMHRARGAWQSEADDLLLDARALLAIAGNGTPDNQQILAVGVYDLALLKQGGQWRRQPTPQGGGAGSLTAVWASPVPGEFYVVGTLGRIYHVRGTIWQREAMDLAPEVRAGVWGRGGGTDQEVYAVGASGRILHRKGTTWSIEADGLVNQQLNAVYGVGSDVYAVGDGGVVVHRQGGTWTVEPTPTTAHLTGVWGAGEEVFAIGHRGTVLRRSAGAWRVENVTLTSEHLFAIWGTVRGGQPTVYVAGNLGTVLRREQATWALLSTRITQVPLSSVWARSPDEVYAVGAGGTIFRRRGTSPLGAWTLEGEGVTDKGLSGVAGHASSRDTGEADVYAVGAEGTILHRLAGSWLVEGAVLTGQDLTAVWVGADAVYAVGRGGRIARKQDGRWSLEKLPAGVPESDLFTVWGTGQGANQTVYAGGAGGLIVRRFQGAWAREAEGLTTDTVTSIFGRYEDVYAMGKGGVFRREGGRWVTEPVKLNGRTPVAGCAVPGTTDLLAIASMGAILRSVGASWVADVSGLTNHELVAISASAADDVYIVGASGIVLHKY